LAFSGSTVPIVFDRTAALITSSRISSAPLADVPAERLYRILQLRSAVFVVEQECAFLDLDGRDLEPGVVQWWLEDDRGDVVASLRVLPTADGYELGRVVTAPPVRRRGHARRLLDAALESCGRPVLINAQSQLLPWYASFGFARSGDDFLDDGILHTPMRLS
jgi:ElaA protein